MIDSQDAQTDPPALHLFVDEAGDGTLFSRGGRERVGTEGCSRYFMLGSLRAADPAALATDLTRLRMELLADPYFRGVPSFDPSRGKTAEKFHAKDDLPEVRREVFRLLTRHKLRFRAVVRDKAELLADVRVRNIRDAGYRYHENELYDDLVAALFAAPHDEPEPNDAASFGEAAKAADVRVCFSRRGKRDRTRALAEALSRAEAAFERRYGFARRTPTVTAAAPAEQGGLQAVDYFLWAIQRRYERGEDRYLDLVASQVAEVRDFERPKEDGARPGGGTAG
jgi:hypothetical protein